MSDNRQLRVVREIYGGLAITEDPHIKLAFAARKDLVEVSADGQFLRVLEPAIERVTPRCPHFGTCGGCQYQMIEGRQQADVKRRILWEELSNAGIVFPIEIPAHSAEPYGYRNRIRLRVEDTGGQLRLGYNIRSTTEFLPILTCPIAAPILWDTAQSLLAAAAHDRDAAFWLAAASEIELFCNHDQTQLQITFFCAPRTKAAPGSFERAFAAFQSHATETATITSAGAIASDPRTGPTGRTLATAGATGIAYTVAVPHGPPETYWITRGGFFQVNRFLLDTLVKLVCFDNDQPRSGALAWDLYAGVGLFSRILVRKGPSPSFAHVTAVEANPVAAADLRVALAKLSPGCTAIESTTLDFLRSAVLQRERPELIVLDPPRAGAGLEVCALLTRLAPATIIYVSCDPTTLARDLAALQSHYRIAALHLVDLFPQTFHIETVAILEHLP